MKSTNKIFIIFNLLLISNYLYASEKLYDESLEDILNTKTEIKAEIGSRADAKNFLDSRSPVDVITHEQIEHSGLTSVVDVLRYFVAGFNAPSTTVTDGSDHVQIYTLRGMNPDQILVLVDGKRVHTSGLLHVNSTIGRGTSHVDLETIALASIEKIEILRDGAAAQYGSDAISGIINIKLKGNGYKNTIALHSGARLEGDGIKLHADTFISTPLDYDGFVNLTMSAEQQNQTQRAGADKRLSTPEVHTHIGIPESRSYKAVANAEVLEIDDVIIYANSILNYRDSKASAFFRTPDANRSIYPNGFLPIINAKILDYALTAGAKGELFDIDWDLSNVYGVNKFNFNVYDSMNYSLGAASPTSFDNGSLIFTQNSTNLDFKKKISKLSIVSGLELRYENYEIQAGDEASYTNNNDLTQKAGSQGFAGYMPINEVDNSRLNAAIYLDSIYKFSNDFSLEGAMRYEYYSDFGSTDNYKLALAYKVIPELLLRSSISTGFRAPSLSQSNYSHTSMFADNNNELLTKGIFRVNHEVSQTLGAKELAPEKSKHLTLGSVFQPTKDISFMIDYFYTNVQDKIMLSNNMKATTAEQISAFTKYGVAEARYFTNAIDTQTYGVDAKFNYLHTFENNSKLDFGVWYSYNKNKVIAFNTTEISREDSYSEIDKIENGQPKDSLRVLTNYKINNLNIMLNLSKYGSYQQVVGGIPYTFNPKWTTDLDIDFEVCKDINVAIGGTNIFDVMPNKWNNLSGTWYAYDGMIPYSNYSPFGYSGAYYYAKVNLKF